MREVGVDLHEHVVAAVDADREAGAVRRRRDRSSSAGRSTSMPPELGADLVGEIGGAVGAVVVDDEDVGVGGGSRARAEELLDVLRLLVRRRHDERPHSAGT